MILSISQTYLLLAVILHSFYVYCIICLSVLTFGWAQQKQLKKHNFTPVLNKSYVHCDFSEWFWRRRFFNFVNVVNVFSPFCYYLPFEKGGALYLNNIESPSPKDALCKVWLKLAQWFWRRRCFNFVNVFSLFRNYLSLKKGRGPSFDKTLIRFTQGCFVPSLVEIGPVVLER